jgi:hypothetical protein
LNKAGAVEDERLKAKHFEPKSLHNQNLACSGQHQKVLEVSEAYSFQRKTWETSQDQEPTTYLFT